jgi:hypothetical protein
MKSDNLLRHLAIPFGIALVVYAISYTWIEHRRTYKGPWEVTFTNDVSGAAALVINQPSLAITNLQITFPGELARTNASLSFSTPHQVPYDLPYGKMVFMDTTFLPGTIVIDLFGHEVQLIPRVLTIDKTDYPWASGKTIAVTGTNAAEPARTVK